MSVELAPVARHPGSADDLGPFLNVITWVLLITSALAVLTRLVTKRALKRRIDVDDALVVGALITSIGSGVSVSFQTANGLGQDFESLAESQIVAYEKSEYATKLLYIATLAFAKLSIISLLMILIASELHRRLGIFLSTFIAVWGIVSEFATAFQCGTHEPWRSFLGERNCFNTPAFWRATGAINMLTDLALIMFPVHVIVTLQMSAGKKLTILVFFSARSLDIIATGVQLAYTHAFSSPNPTLALWKWTLMTQIVQCITILTSCVPYLRPLLESIPSGMYGADELRRRRTSTSTRDNTHSKSDESYKLSNTSTWTGGNKSRRSDNESCRIKRCVPILSLDSTAQSNSASGIPGGPSRLHGQIGVAITAPRAPDHTKWETESTGSQAKIIKTTVVSAAWEEAETRSSEGSEDVITRESPSRI
ncbi:uncharacterized protein BDR25DRAFT_212428 [Lindgomyces ingoldianus]|uniref:Uncharacterized protein n=1 Tax=Lindgomyces ingoldianus TaxID=673940 RepID=A0ACB6RAT6_9PLEO|nr:uncharacterized protein BDR25DRAFT_212428 [Lindgomyces ingoldianus]KAF2475868.1 hypothetical protein BDR25DRAFT_212428 [Lindgomyces ingoldianus]